MTENKFINFETAKKLLPNRKKIHSLRDIPGLCHLGLDWDKDSLLEHMKKYENTLQLAGENAKSIGHGLALEDNISILFIETIEKELGF